MLVLGYHLDQIERLKIKGQDLQMADASSLRYGLFLGDIIMKCEGADFSTIGWMWVPVLDFAIYLDLVAEGIERYRVDELDFAESDDVLRFELQNNDVLVSSSYAPGVICVQLQYFRQCAHAFLRKVVQELCEENPSLTKNKEIINMGLL